MNPIIPKNGLPDWAAIVIVYGQGGRTPLVRNQFKPNPVLWKFPGGKKEGMETILQTARRELKYETGLVVPETSFELIKEVDKSWHTKPHTLFVFRVRVNNFDGLSEFGIEGGEKNLEVKLFDRSEILEMNDFLNPHKEHFKEMIGK